MKKLFSLVCLMLLLSVTSRAQSNTTWTIKDRAEKGFFKTATTFHTHLSGFTARSQSDALMQSLKANGNIAAATLSNTDANGNGDLLLVMKTAQDKKYYIGLAQKLGIQYLEVNGTKKTPAQWLQKK